MFSNMFVYFSPLKKLRFVNLFLHIPSSVIPHLFIRRLFFPDKTLEIWIKTQPNGSIWTWKMRRRRLGTHKEVDIFASRPSNSSFLYSSFHQIFTCLEGPVPRRTFSKWCLLCVFFVFSGAKLFEYSGKHAERTPDLQIMPPPSDKEW